MTVDFLTHEGAAEQKSQLVRDSNNKGNKIVVTALLITAVWFIAATIFVYIMLNSHIAAWMTFVWAVPASMVVGSIAVRKWSRHVLRYVTDSVLLWSVLICVCLQFMQYNVWALLIVGIPIQVALILLSKIKR